METENQYAHESVLALLYLDIITTEQANKLHSKINEILK